MKNKALTLDIIAPFVPFPTALVDQVMPTLRDTEWRLLCVVVRQTLGWSENGRGRKARDWLSQRQLMARTGRNSAALSAALDVLVRRRLIETRDEGGELLLTPQERRRYQGRLYFGLCEETLQNLSGEATRTPLRKVNTTKETQDKKEIIKKDVLKRRGNSPALLADRGWSKAEEIMAARYSGANGHKSTH